MLCRVRQRRHRPGVPSRWEGGVGCPRAPLFGTVLPCLKKLRNLVVSLPCASGGLATEYKKSEKVLPVWRQLRRSVCSSWCSEHLHRPWNGRKYGCAPGSLNRVTRWSGESSPALVAVPWHRTSSKIRATESKQLPATAACRQAAAPGGGARRCHRNWACSWGLSTVGQYCLLTPNVIVLNSICVVQAAAAAARRPASSGAGAAAASPHHCRGVGCSA